MNIIIPTLLIVALSWVSFWLRPEFATARVGLGMTAVLTMLTLITTTNNSMPKLGYIKALDIFFYFCLIMVFASVVEYVIVLRQAKKNKQNPTNPAGRPLLHEDDDVRQGRVVGSEPSKVDELSRWVFPVVFIGFNIVFWLIMIIISWLADSGDYVPAKNSD